MITNKRGREKSADDVVILIEGLKTVGKCVILCVMKARYI